MIDGDLTTKILNPTSDDVEVESNRTMRQIFTLGELAQICPARINKRLFLLMQSIIFQQGTKHRNRKKKNLAAVSHQQQAEEEKEDVTVPTSQTQVPL
jgi:hypothetical protein